MGTLSQSGWRLVTCCECQLFSHGCTSTRNSKELLASIQLSTRLKIEFDATDRIVGVVCSCFHNLALHGSGEHLRSDFVRWALDLRYERAPDPTRYKQGNQYYQQFPSFLCRVGDAGNADSSSGEAIARRRDELVSWQEWLEMWSAAAKSPAEEKAEENAPRPKPRL